MDANSTAVLILLGSFFLMISLCFPIAYAVALSSMFYLLFQGHNPITVCRQMVKGISFFSLMAVSFFIIMGCLMGSGGVSGKLITLVNACIGWMRGGMTVVNTVASYLFGGISGSVSADMASPGSILIPMMADQGYNNDFLTAVTITSSCEGLLVPLNHNMVIYATTTGDISARSLFLAGYIPGALLAITLMVGPYIIPIKRSYPKDEKFSTVNLVKQLSASFWALAIVLVVVFDAVDGVSMATESITVAVIYSLIVNMFIYKELDWEEAWRVLGGSVDILSIVVTLIVTPNIFEFRLTRLHVPVLAVSATTGMTNNPILLALLLSLILLILGYIMDMAPIILIATPILLPIVISIGLGSVQFGIVVALNCGIGLLTLPVGVTLFISSAVSKMLMERVVKAVLPSHVCMIIALLLITFIPAVNAWPPSVLTH